MRAGRWLLLILLLAGTVRVATAWRAAMISRDGAVFVWYAQRLAVDPLAEMRAQDQHPLYPALVLGTHAVLEQARRVVIPVLPGDPVVLWTLAGVLVSLVGGIAAVAAVYVLASACFDRRAGLWAALLAALAAEWVQLSADVLTDMPHLAVYLLSLACGVHALRGGRIGWLALAGGLAGVGFLLRPEGASPAVVTLLCWAVQRGRPWRRRLLGGWVLCLCAAVVASPYMALTGKLVPKKSIGQMIWGQYTPASTAEESEPPRHPGRQVHRLTSHISHLTFCPALLTSSFPQALAILLEKYTRSLRITLLLPVIVWLLLRRRWPMAAQAGRLLSGAAGLHLLLLLGLILHFDYAELISLRHVLIWSALTLVLSGAGLAALTQWLGQARQRWMMVVVTGLIGPTLPWMFEARHAEDLAIRQAGEWLRSQPPTRPRVMAERFRAAFYADGVRVWMPLEADPATILAEARWSRPDWIVFSTRYIGPQVTEFFDRLHATLLPGEVLELAHMVPPVVERRGRIIIYRYHAPPTSRPADDAPPAPPTSRPP